MSTATSSITRARLEREQWRARIQRALQELRGSIEVDAALPREAGRSDEAPSSTIDRSI
jgi:hypothetical protein